MSKVIISKSKLDTLADTVAEKAGASAPLTLDEMVSEVTGLTKVEGSINITVNGSIDVTHYAEANVAVPEPEMQSKSVSFTPTKATQTQNITPDAGKDGLSSVNVTVNPIPSEYIIPSGTKQITENGTANVAEFASVDVNVQGGGGGAAEPNDVEYIDYDGTIVYSYSAADFAQLTAHPANPSHDGLVAQGWNWTLTDAQAYVAEYGGLVIGQMYITESGDTEIDVVMPEGRLTPELLIAINGTATVDFGDGSTPVTLTGTSLTNSQVATHTYASAGSYTITIHIDSGSFTFHNTNRSTILRKGTVINESRVYANCVQAIRFGAGLAKIGDYAFYYCGSLATVSMPGSVSSINQYAFAYCYSLAALTIPNGAASIGNYAIEYCYSLTRASIPKSVASIGQSAFTNAFSLVKAQIPDTVTEIKNGVFSYCSSASELIIPNSVGVIGTTVFQQCAALQKATIPNGITALYSSVFASCYGLSKITIPSSVTSLAGSAISYCYGLGEIHVAAATPPTISSNTFNGVPSDCKFYVPAESLEAYKTAQYWSNFASQMVGE